jgi:hypothetical protein
MPVGYEIPNWIKGPGNLAQDFLSGLQAGSQIAHQRAALQQQAQISAVNAQVQQQQLQMQAERQRQQIEMQRAYHDQVTQIRQQQLADQQQKIGMATQMAAQKFAAQQAYSKRVASGEDPAKVLLELGPSMGASAGDLGAALRSGTGPKDIVPKAFSVGGRSGIYNPATGSFKTDVAKKEPTLSVPIDPTNPYGPKISGPASDPKVQAALEKAQKAMEPPPEQKSKVGSFLSHLFGVESPGMPTPDQYPEVPAKDKRKTGQTYRSPKGLFTWSGTGWKPFEPASQTPAKETEEETPPTEEEEP